MAGLLTVTIEATCNYNTAQITLCFLILCLIPSHDCQKIPA